MVDKVSEQETNPLKSRREEEKEERRNQVLDAAEVVISREGWEKANFGMIAKEARLSRSLVYFYFKTRDDLFHAICERSMVELQKRFTDAISKHELGIDQAMEIGRAYHRFANECPLYFTLLSEFQGREADPENPTDAEKAANFRGRSCLELVAQALGKGLLDGSIRPSIGDPAQTAVTVWAFTHGLIQICTKKAEALERDMGMDMKLSMDHGFMLMRQSLESIPPVTK